MCRVQYNIWLSAAAGTFSTLASNFSAKSSNFIENMMLIDRQTEVKVAVVLW